MRTGELILPEGIEPYYHDKEAGIVLYCGDCRDILPRMQAGSVDLVLTDPPYWVGYDYDGKSDSEMAYVVPQSLVDEARRIAHLVAVTTGTHALPRYPAFDWLMGWFKPGSTRQSGLGGFNIFEPIAIYGKPRRPVWQDANWLPSVANLGDNLAGKHPCPKPLRLIEWLIAELSDTGDVVLDAFAGSGTTLVAAKILGRRAIGIEIEERYCEIAVNRLRQSVLPLHQPAPAAEQLALEER